MRKGILFSLVCLIAIVSVACGGGNNSVGNKAVVGNNSACGGGCGGGGAADAYALYKKEGRSWTYKSTSKAGEQPENVSYTKYTITKVTDKEATQEMTMMDKDKKALESTEYMKNPSVSQIPLVAATTTTTDGTATKVEMKEETIELLGKKWDAYVTETDTNGMKTKSWSSKDYPGLSLKSESTGEVAGVGKMTSTTELVDWTE